MAVMLEYQVTVCELRDEDLGGWDSMPGTMLSTTMPDDLVLAMHLDERCDRAHPRPNLDDPALMEALRRPAFYVGTLGSFQNNAKRSKRLLKFDVRTEEAAKLHGTVGLNLGALTPPEIALIIVAETTGLRRGMDLSGPLSNWAARRRSAKLGGQEAKLAPTPIPLA